MQTFLPYPDFSASARCLDRARLGKQRVEVLQLLRAILFPVSGWRNHPAARMWRSHPSWLADYGLTVCREWRRRGYRDSCLMKIHAICSEYDLIPFGDGSNGPRWLGDPAFHASHRSNLLRKALHWYSQFGWTESSDLPYVWPA